MACASCSNCALWLSQTQPARDLSKSFGAKEKAQTSSITRFIARLKNIGVTY
jgi:hypothetical protein